MSRWVRAWLVKRHAPRVTHYAADCPCRHCRRFGRWLGDIDSQRTPSTATPTARAAA